MQGGVPLSPLKIRWAEPDDCTALGRVHSEAYRSAYMGIMPEHYLRRNTAENRERYYREALEKGPEKVAILIANDQPAGVMVVGGSCDDDLDSSHGEIRSIYLMEGVWGNGYGTAFLGWGIERLAEFGYRNAALWVLEDNKRARSFCERFGFRKDGTHKTITRGKELVQSRYVTSLNPHNEV
ncbi:GNAT family N-acetyltransferase [Paenibacillus hemerocallicola]|uniref:GNAT family N-acetyltransferase n=1 Tax=Paenibacillus hemerocallicola TaxID=1172614 RepID=A0A5C4SVI0_9BACL|nr:GNAT family N-acetyltransferase [Paenibacillus hemerocallicola]